MAILFVHHKVEDYPKWRKVFDDLTATRTSYGMSGQQVFQVAGDPNDVVIFTTWPSVEKAREYATSDDLRQGMQNAGVASQPGVLFLKEA
jgi:heme-degrading monooxygenase HmoA